jgi:fatty acid desaturase
VKASDFISDEQIKYFSRKSDLHGFWVLFCNWAAITSIFTAVAIWTNPFTIFAAILLFGGRQLGLGVINHECGHASLFKKWKYNKFAGHWLAAAFVFSDARGYRSGHTKHHRLGGTKQDPDLQNYVNYAVTRDSFRRKMLRDITGRTGYKTILQSAKAFGKKTVASWAIAHFVMWAVLYACGQGWLYLMWPAAWMTSNMVIVRIRNAAEHAAVPDQFDPDPRKHTRTTLPRWWEKPFLAPNNVNYHLEHHILPSVPCYRLKAFHEYLKEEGILESAEICHSYWEVVKQLVLPADDEGGQPAPTS